MVPTNKCPPAGIFGLAAAALALAAEEKAARTA